MITIACSTSSPKSLIGQLGPNAAVKLVGQNPTKRPDSARVSEQRLSRWVIYDKLRLLAEQEVGTPARDSELRKANEFFDHRIPSAHDDLEDISESRSDLDEVSSLVPGGPRDHDDTVEPELRSEDACWSIPSGHGYGLPRYSSSTRSARSMRSLSQISCWDLAATVADGAIAITMRSLLTYTYYVTSHGTSAAPRCR